MSDEIERDKLRLEWAKLQHERRKLAFDGLYPLATLTISSLILINGGAAVALATFVANQKGIVPISTEDLGRAIEAFGYGVLYAVASAAVGYLSQYAFMWIESTGRRGWKWCAVEVILRVLAFGAAIYSGWQFLDGTRAAIRAF